MRINLTSFQCHFVPYRKVQMNGNQTNFLFSHFSSLWKSNNQLWIDSILNKWLTYQKINNKHREKKMYIWQNSDKQIGQNPDIHISHILAMYWIFGKIMQNKMDWKLWEVILILWILIESSLIWYLVILYFRLIW